VLRQGFGDCGKGIAGKTFDVYNLQKYWRGDFFKIFIFVLNIFNGCVKKKCTHFMSFRKFLFLII